MTKCETGSQTDECEEGKWVLLGPAKPRNRSAKVSEWDIERWTLEQQIIQSLNQCQYRPGVRRDSDSETIVESEESEADSSEDNSGIEEPAAKAPDPNLPKRSTPEVSIQKTLEVASRAPEPTNINIQGIQLEKLFSSTPSPVVSPAPTLPRPAETSKPPEMESIEDALAQFDQTFQRIKSQDVARKKSPPILQFMPSQHQWPPQTQNPYYPYGVPPAPMAHGKFQMRRVEYDRLKDGNGIVKVPASKPQPSKKPPVEIIPEKVPQTPISSLLRDMLTAKGPLANEIMQYHQEQRALRNAPIAPGQPPPKQQSLLDKLLEKPPPHLSILNKRKLSETETVEIPISPKNPGPSQPSTPEPSVETETIAKMPIGAYLTSARTSPRHPPRKLISRSNSQASEPVPKKYYIRKVVEPRPQQRAPKPRPSPVYPQIYKTEAPPKKPFQLQMSEIPAPNRKRKLEAPNLSDQIMQELMLDFQPNQEPSLANLNRLDEDEDLFETLAVDLGGPESVSTSTSDDGSQSSLYGDNLMDDYNSMSMFQTTSSFF